MWKKTLGSIVSLNDTLIYRQVEPFIKPPPPLQVVKNLLSLLNQPPHLRQRLKVEVTETRYFDAAPGYTAHRSFGCK